MHQQPFLAAVDQEYLEQLVRITAAKFRILHHLRQLFVERLVAARPVDLHRGVREEKGHEVGKVPLRDLLPRTVVVVGHAGAPR